MRNRMIIVCGLAGIGLIATTLLAAGLDAPAAPTSPGSAMFTLTDIYNRLMTGAVGSKRTGGFTEPGAAPAPGTMRTIDEIMGKAPAVQANGASPAEVLAGRGYWGLIAGQWGPATGAMVNVGAQTLVPGPATQTITQGYHDGTGRVTVDPNLAAGNIRAGVTLNGVTGDPMVVNTTSGDVSAAGIVLGKKAWVKGAEVTGNLGTASPHDVIPGVATYAIPPGYYVNQSVVHGDPELATGNIRADVEIFGVIGSATVVDTSPANATGGEILLGRKAYTNGQLTTGTRVGGFNLPSTGAFYLGATRWFKPGDGTVIDCLTGLVWLSNVPDIVRPYIATDPAELDCMRWLYTVRHGQYGLTDNSQPGDWDMPTLRELETLFIDIPPGQAVGTFSARAFDNYYLDKAYWTSTPLGDKIYVIWMRDGAHTGEDRIVTNPSKYHLVWPIRRHHRW